MKTSRAVAALLAAAVSTTLSGYTASAQVSPRATICNKYCDARDPALSPGDRAAGHRDASSAAPSPCTSTTPTRWAGRRSTNGNPGDEVWLDRSFDGGRTWASGSKLGDTADPGRATAAGARLMYNVDDWNNLGVGALRACGKAGDRPDIACTAWARTTWNAGDRRTAAATALMEFYNHGTGLFDTTGWWNSANALTAVIDNIRVTGMDSYTYAIARTYDLNVNAAEGQLPQRLPGRHRLVGARLGRRLRPDRRQPLPEHRPRRRRLHGRLLGQHLRRRHLVEHREDVQERHRQLALPRAQRRHCTTGSPATPPTSSGRRPSWTWFQRHRDDQRLAPGQRRHRPVDLPTTTAHRCGPTTRAC